MTRSLLATGVLVCGLLGMAPGAWAQSSLPFDAPEDRRPELPDFEPPPSDRPKVLPEIRLPEAGGMGALSAGARIPVEGFRIVGNVALSGEALLPLISDHAGRSLSYTDLENLRDKLTYAYIEAGYVSSGAVIPEQEIVDGIVEFRIVEGVLGEVQVSSRRFRESYFESRLLATGSGIVDIHEIDERLQRFQDDPRIRKIDAQLLPAADVGKALLRVDVSERSPYRASLEVSNYATPSIGAYAGTLTAGYDNAIGIGDAIDASFTATEGLLSVTGDLRAPVNRWDTALHAYARWNESKVVEDEFDDLDIESEALTLGLAINHPAYQSRNVQLDVFAAGEWRRSESFLLGQSFSFAPGVEDGVVKVAALRFGANGVYRDRRQVLSLRSTVSVGIDALGATSSSDAGTPDGEFVSWLGQLQWARRTPLFDTLVVFRTDVQLSDDPLVGLEQLAIGGHSSIRGYRQNLFVSDNGLVFSLEGITPLFRRADGSAAVEVGPIFDAGHPWNVNGSFSDEPWIYSVGIAGRWWIGEHFYLNGSWAQALNDVSVGGDWDLQDSGVYFQLVARY